MGDAGGRMPARGVREIRNNLMGSRIRSAKESGTIPYRLLEDKYEYTEFGEDPQRSDKYMRNSAKYNGPDNVAFEQDAPRKHAMYDAGKLNLRLNASLGTKDVNHSEMFIGFTDRDPRGTNEDPDFRHMAKDMWHRGKQYVKSQAPDKGEDIITGGGYNPWKMQNDKVKMFYPIKNRTRIFSTSLDSAPNPTMKPMNYRTHKMNLANAGIEMDEKELEDIYRSPDYTTALSLGFPVLGNTVADHRLPVARYGDTRPYTLLSDLNLHTATDINGLKEQKESMTRSYNHKVTDLVVNALSDHKRKDHKDSHMLTVSKPRDVERFITEYTKSKVNVREHERVNDKFNSSISDNIAHSMQNSVRDNKSKRNFNDVTNRKLMLQSAAINAMQENEIKYKPINEHMNVAYKVARANVKNNMDSHIVSVHGRDIETVSYKTAPVIGSLSADNYKYDIDFADNEHAKRVLSGKVTKTSKFTDNNIHIHTPTGDIGDDGSFMRKHIRNRQKVTFISDTKDHEDIADNVSYVRRKGNRNNKLLTGENENSITRMNTSLVEVM